MTDAECVAFLQWALPRLRLRWPGFRKVRRQVCRRIRRRLDALGLADVDAYRAYLEATPAEWERLDGLCRVTISRFARDRTVFELLRATVLPELARGARARGRALEAWSAGCGSGEEPYTLALVWLLGVGAPAEGIRLHVLATDVDEALLARARAAEYAGSSLRELPAEWRRAAFIDRDGTFRLRERFRRPVELRRHDLRHPPPAAPFDLVLCRNVAFTYFDAGLQRETAARLASCTRSGGALVLGAHERLPEDGHGFVPWSDGARVYRRSGA
ncbi:MAG TPA: CheR family methyltransferase [Gaiellaceae bacterium]|nr:CheR family methyltransferase [Gaiellaceae bacterium]